MKKIQILLLAATLGLMIQACKKNETAVSPAKGDGLPIGQIDTRGLDRYISIAETLIAQKEPTQTEWDSLFTTPYYYLAINTVKFTTPADEQDAMRTVYKSKTLTAAQQADYSHHLNYKNNLAKLKAYSASVKDATIRNTLKTFLYPFIPTRLQADKFIPPIAYTYFYQEEAQGLDNMIIQDAWLAYQTDTYSKGLLTAHEALHSTLSVALKSRTKIILPDTDVRQIIAATLVGISQEGIADLIDKDKLSQKDSPVFELFKSLQVDETNRSIAFIKALDAELSTVSTTKTISNGNAFRQKVSGFAGHQPGRYMAKAIQKAGFLPEVINDAENPFPFIYAYNKAAAKLGGTAYPIISDKTITYLKSVEAELVKPL
jgi:Putative zinc dependent peptidase (DUF5700)